MATVARFSGQLSKASVVHRSSSVTQYKFPIKFKLEAHYRLYSATFINAH